MKWLPNFKSGSRDPLLKFGSPVLSPERLKRGWLDHMTPFLNIWDPPPISGTGDSKHGCMGVVVEYRTRNREVAGLTQIWSTARNLQQVANLLRAQANSASYPQQDGKWVVTQLVWLIGAMVCLPWVQLSVSVGNGWPHNALWHQWLMPISCHFRDCKALLVMSLTHVSGAIASARTFTFTFQI